MRDYLQDKREKQKQQRKRRIRFFLFFLFVILLFGAFLFFLYEGFFSVKTIHIEGNQQVEKQIIESNINTFLKEQASVFSYIYHEEPLMFFSSKELEKHLLESIPYTSSVSIEKDIFTKNISVSVLERSPYGILCSVEEGKSCWWFDESGVVFLSDVYSKGHLIRTVRMKNISPQMLSSFLSDKQFQIIKETFLFLENLSWPQRTIVIEESIFEEGYIPQDGSHPAIHISLRHSPLFAQSAIQELDIKKLEYIDLRVKNRIFYR